MSGRSSVGEPATVAGIFGDHSTGKSNLLDSILWLADAAAYRHDRGRGSLSDFESDFLPPATEPFAYRRGEPVPSRFAAEVEHSGIRHAYEVEVRAGAPVSEERLSSYPTGRRRTAFSRSPTSGIKLGREVPAKATLRSLSRPEGLLLPMLALLRDDHPLQPVASQIAAWRNVRRVASTAEETLAVFAEPSSGSAAEARETSLRLVRAADPTIEDVRKVRLSDDWMGMPKRWQVVHAVGGAEHIVPPRFESAGVKAALFVAAEVAAAMQQQRLLVIDDLGMAPRLASAVLGLFADPCTNEHGSQIVFSSCDRSLIEALESRPGNLPSVAWNAEAHLDGSTSFAEIDLTRR